MATIVQGGPKVNFTADQLQRRSQIIYTKFTQRHSPVVPYDYEFPVIPVDAVLSERELMAVASVSAILRGSGLSAMEVSHAAIFVLHIALLNHLSLPQRRFDYVEPQSTAWKGSNKTFGWIIVVSRHFLGIESYRQAAARLESNIHDYIDGRLFGKLRSQIESGDFQPNSFPEPVLKDFVRMAGAIEAASGFPVSLPSQIRRNSHRPSVQPVVDACAKLEVLPFSNPTFDVFLSQIKLAVDTSAGALEVDNRNRRLQGPTQRHTGRFLEERIPVAVPASWRHRDPKGLASWRLKRDQLYVFRMTKYAASLVGAKGKMLEPIVITKDPTQLAIREPSTTRVVSKVEKKNKSKAGSKKADIRAENNKKLSEKGDLALQRMWKTICRDIQTIMDDETKILKLDQFLDNISSNLSDKGYVVQTEVRLYKIWVLQRIWAGVCRADTRNDGYEVVVMIFDEARKVLVSKGLTKRVHEILGNLFRALGIAMPLRGSPRALLDIKLSFNTTWDGTSAADIGLRMTSTEFQLRCCGQYMDRDMGSKPDPRVSFEPDEWQRKVLDEIDQNNSVFVVAPTSAGKTFISFYAMEKVRKLLWLYLYIWLDFNREILGP